MTAEPEDLDLVTEAEPEAVPVTVIKALSLEAGTMLGQCLNLWIEEGEPCFARRHLIGPAGSVALVTIQIENVDPGRIVKAGHG